MFIYYFILQIFLLPVHSFDLDSLEKAADSAVGAEKIRVHQIIAATYEAIPIEKRLFHAKQGLMLAKELGNDTLIASMNKFLAIAYYYDYDFENAQKYFFNAKKIFERLNDEQGLSTCLNNLGLLYTIDGNYSKAIEHYLDALRLNDKLNNKNGQAKAYNNIGQVYYYWNNYRKADDYFRKAYEFYIETSDTHSLPSVMHNIGASNLNIGLGFIADSNDIFYDYKKLDKNPALNDSTKYYFNIAIAYIDSALKLNQYSSQLENNAILLSQYGVIRAYQGNDESAEEYFTEAAAKFDIEGNPEMAARNYINLGVVSFRQDKISKAESSLLKAAEIAEETNIISVQADAYSALMHYYETRDNYKQAYEFSLKASSIKDSIFNQDVYAKILELEEEYQSEKRETELKLTKSQKKILTQRQLFYIITLSLMFLALILVILLLRNKNKNNKTLKDKNGQLATINKELNEIKDELYESNVAKDKFFSIISHDLKNPISSFKQVTQFLNEEYDTLNDIDKKEIIYELKNYSENLFNLLENLLTWSRAQRGNINYAPGYEDLHDIAEFTIETLKMQAANKNIKINNNIKDNTVAYIDPNLTSTILRNFISNAIKYSKNKSEIDVISENAMNGKIHVSVIDRGVGIDHKLQDRLFKISNKVTTVGTANETGTGLGLIICKEFAEKQGGNVLWESVPDKGSKFTFTVNEKARL